MISEQAINKRFDELLGAVNKGFQGMQDQFQGLEGRFEGLEGKFEGLQTEMRSGFTKVNDRLEVVEGRVNAMVTTIGNWPAPSTIQDLMGRTTYIEGKLKIKPGEFRSA